MPELQKKHNPNIAFCVGSLQAANSVLKGLGGYCTYSKMNLHIFDGFTNAYDENDKHDIGRVNIFNLPNFDILDMLVIMPFDLTISKELTRHVIDRALSKNVPVLTIGEKHKGCYCITSDYTAEIKALTEHFIKDHGFTDLCFMTGHKENDPVARLREEGFRQALIENGLEFSEDRIYFGDFWDEPAQKATEQMLTERKTIPQAIVCANDSMASGVIRKLAELNYRVPDDICVCGMDGSDEAINFITTARIFSEKTGEMAGQLVHKLIVEKESIDEVTFVPPDILFANSCGCNNSTENVSPKKRHDLFAERYWSENYAAATIRLTQDLSDCNSLEQAVTKLKDKMQKMWVDALWLCIGEDFMSNISDITINNADAVAQSRNLTIHSHDFSENMYCAVQILDKELKDNCTFRTSQMLPDFYENADKSGIILYSPLHYRDNTMGYLAFDYFPWSNVMYLLNILTISISSMLEAVRRQSELYVYAKKVDELYITDALTSLYNRRGFFMLYSKIAEEKHDYDYMVVSVDLDNLKQINDNFGHNEGDIAIKVVSDALKSAAQNGEICARFGGDEYVVFGKCDSQDYLDNYIKAVGEYIDEYNRVSGKPYNVHASIGSVIMPANTKQHIDFFINTADAKMYVSKEKHKRTRTLMPGGKLNNK